MISYGYLEMVFMQLWPIVIVHCILHDAVKIFQLQFPLILGPNYIHQRVNFMQNHFVVMLSINLK